MKTRHLAASFLTLLSVMAAADPALSKNGSPTASARQIHGTYDVILSGDALPSSNLLVHSEALISRDLPSISLNTIMIKTNSSGHYMTHLAMGADYWAGSVVTIHVFSPASQTGTETTLKLQTPNFGSITPAEADVRR